jgi:hypothetical protein
VVAVSVQYPPTPAQPATNNHDIGPIGLGATLAEMKQLGASLTDNGLLAGSSTTAQRRASTQDPDGLESKIGWIMTSLPDVGRTRTLSAYDLAEKSSRRNVGQSADQAAWLAAVLLFVIVADRQGRDRRHVQLHPANPKQSGNLSVATARFPLSG